MSDQYVKMSEEAFTRLGVDQVVYLKQVGKLVTIHSAAGHQMAAASSIEVAEVLAHQHELTTQYLQ